MGELRHDVDPAESPLAGAPVAAPPAPGCSVEATRPNPAEIALLAERLAPGTEIYLTALPGRTPDDHLNRAAALARAGLTPVPHLAARRIASRADLAAFLDAARRQAAVRQLLLVAGDRNAPLGPYADSEALLADIVSAGHGFVRVGFAGFPDGHPHAGAADDTLALLRRKLSRARDGGLEPFVITQFGFDAAPIVRWLTHLRDAGIDCPVRIGIAGPASPATLARFAAKCGVRQPGGGLLARLKLARTLLAGDPGLLLDALDRAGVADGAFGPVGYHVFTFGGLARTLDWLAARTAAPHRQFG
ncbi:MAG: methylenetetrahydrofolate reductase [Azospirillaceae bacterium]